MLIQSLLFAQGLDYDYTIVDTLTVVTYKIKGRTASGIHTHKIKGKFLAISRDLLGKYPLHSKVKIYDCIWKGTYRVMDIMGQKHTYSADIFYKGKKRNAQKCLCKKKWNKFT